jgi:ethanolamine ammonia-lyase small subunit
MSEPSSRTPSVAADPWTRLRQHTAARIALGRSGSSLPTDELLRFALDHALARDAVHSEMDVDQLEKDLAEAAGDLPIVRVATRVTDRITYLQRPDRGRELDQASRDRLARMAPADGVDIALIVADGLSATAAQRHAAPLCQLLLPSLRHAGLSLAPLAIARYARVALEDDIGSALKARCSVILIGERPGLGTPDSLGAYLVFNPRPGNTDAQRNCVSNIRPAGLPLAAAAETLHYLITESLRRRISGVNLKDERIPRLRGPQVK